MCHHTPLTCTGTLGDDVEEAPGSATNKKAKKGEAKKGKAKKGKGKGKAKGNAEEWQSEDDTESDGSDGSVKVPMARGRWDLPRAKRGGFDACKPQLRPRRRRLRLRSIGCKR